MDQLALSNQLCFKAYALSRYITGLYQPLLKKLSLTYPQYLVMLVLWEHKEVSVKALGEQLLLDSGTLTPLLKRMEEMNFVVRTRSKEDERVVLVSLTKKGEQLKAKALDIPKKLKSSVGFSEQDYRQFMSFANQMLLTK